MTTPAFKFKKYYTHYLTKITVSLSFPLTAFASSGDDKLKSALAGITDYITGTLGTSLCTLAIIGTGFLWLKTGHLEKEQAVGTMLGIGLIYSASYIVGTVMGIGG